MKYKCFGLEKTKLIILIFTWGEKKTHFFGIKIAKMIKFQEIITLHVYKLQVCLGYEKASIFTPEHEF